MRWAVAVLSGVASTSLALAEPGHEIQAGLAIIDYSHPLGPSNTLSERTALELRYAHAIGHLAASGGARFAIGDRTIRALVFEIFAGVAYTADMGRWRPGIGLELGYSEASETVLDDYPPGNFPARLTHPYPVYIESVAAPARFAIRCFRVEALSLGIGSPIIGLGESVRLELTLLKIGRTF